MRIEDLHWLAGILEGEGCFSTFDGRINITLGMTDRDVVDRAAVMMRPRSVNELSREPHQTLYRFGIHGERALAWMLLLCPRMGKRRQAKIDEIITLYCERQGHNRDRTRCKRGHSLTDLNSRIDPTTGSRVCCECRRVRARERAEEASRQASARSLLV